MRFRLGLGLLLSDVVRPSFTMRAWPVARSIFDAPYVREANEGTTSWIRPSFEASLKSREGTRGVQVFYCPTLLFLNDNVGQRDKSLKHPGMLASQQGQTAFRSHRI